MSSKTQWSSDDDDDEADHADASGAARAAYQFKFRSFAQQLQGVRVDAFRTAAEAADDALPLHVSYFHSALVAARSVTPYDDFIAFSRAVSPLTLSLPLLMHNADAVVALVLEWCPKADAFSRAALVALLPQLARDLQDAFYPYFAPVFSMLVALLDPGQAEALQVLFTCLAFLLKFMRRTLLANLAEVFAVYRPLLDGPTAHVRDFAAQSFAFLLRKVEPARLAPFIAQHLWALADAAPLLYFSARGFSGRMHSAAPRLVSGWFAALELCAPDAQPHAGGAVATALQRCVEYCRQRHPEELLVLWQQICPLLAATSCCAAAGAAIVACAEKLWIPLERAHLLDREHVLDACAAYAPRTRDPGFSTTLVRVALYMAERSCNEALAARVVKLLTAPALPDKGAALAALSARATEVSPLVLLGTARALPMLHDELGLEAALQFVVAAPLAEAYWGDANAVAALVDRVLVPALGASGSTSQQQLALEGCLRVAEASLPRDIACVAQVRRVAERLERAPASSQAVVCAARRVLVACGAVRTAESLLEAQQRPSAESLLALAYCLARDAAAVQLEPLLALCTPHLMARDPRERHAALAALATVSGSDSVLQRLLELQTTPYTVHATDAKSVRLRAANVGSAHVQGRIPAALVPAVACALLGCFHTRFAPVGQGAAVALEAFGGEAVLWTHVSTLLQHLEQQLAAGDDGDTAYPNSTPAFMVWAQLFALIAGPLKASADRFNRTLVPVFLRAAEASAAAADRDLAASAASEDEPAGESAPAAPPRHGRLIEWLKLWQSCTNHQGLHRLPELRAICERLVGHPSPHVQRLALALALRWDPAKVVDGELPARLLAVADGTTMVEALHDFPMASIVQPAVRARIINVLSRLLYPRLWVLGGRHASALATRRSAMLQVLLKFDGAGELDLFVSLLLGPAARVAALPERELHCFAALTLDAVSHLRLALAPYVPALTEVAVALLELGHARWALPLLHQLADIHGDRHSFAPWTARLVAGLEPHLRALATGDVAPALAQLLLSAGETRCMDDTLRDANTLAHLLRAVTLQSPLSAVELAVTLLSRLTPRAPPLEGVEDMDEDDDQEELEDETRASRLPPATRDNEARFALLVQPHYALILEFLHNSTALLKAYARPQLAALQLSVVVRLAHRVESRHARALMALVLPMLEAPVSADEQRTFLCGLALVDRMAHALTAEDCERLLPAVLGLLPVLGAMRESSQRLCRTVQGLCARHAPQLAVAAAMLSDTLAFSQVMLDQVDVNRRLMGLENAVQMATEMSEGAVRDEGLAFALALNPALFLLSSADLTVREQAVRVVCTLLQRAQRVHKGENPPSVRGHVVPVLARYLASQMRHVQDSCMQVLRFCVVEFGAGDAQLAHLLPLIAADNADEANKDFFRAAFHAEQSVRIGGLRLLTKHLLSHPDFDAALLAELVVPAFEHSLFATVDGKSDRATYRRDAVRLLQAALTLLPWDAWHAVVEGLLQRWDDPLLSADAGAVCLQYFCGVMDSFHFAAPGSRCSEADVAAALPVVELVLLPRVRAHLFAVPVLQRRNLGSTQKRVAAGTMINVDVAATEVRLLQKLPAQSFRSFLPSLCRQICNSLTERDEAIRDATRAALGQIVTMLGPRDFGAIVAGLRGALKRGFEMHVLFFSLHVLLQRVHASFKATHPGALDELAGPLSALLLEDILGLTAAKKEVQKVQAHVKEARSTKSFHSFALLAEWVTFPSAEWNETAFQALMQPVVDMLQFASKKKEVTRLREVLANVVAGLSANASVTLSPLFRYCHSLISANLVDSATLRAKSAGLSSSSRQLKPVNVHADSIGDVERRRRELLLTLKENNARRTMLVEQSKRDALTERTEGEDHFAGNRHLLCEMGFQLLLLALKRGKKRDAELVEHLNPFVLLCRRGLFQDEDTVVELALLALKRLVRFSADVPALAEHVGSLASRALALLQRTNPTSALGKACFGLVAAISQHCKAWEVPAHEAAFVLQLILQELDASRDLTGALALLRGLVQRKVLTPEVYNLMGRMQQLAVGHHDPVVRQQCSALLVAFLVHYPLTKRKRRHHVDAMLRDLGFENAMGREAALELLNVCFARFPVELLSELAEVVLVALTVRLANETERHVRSVAGAAVRVLLTKVDDAVLVALFSMVQGWYATADSPHAMQSAAAQLLGLFAETGRLPSEHRKLGLAALETRALALAAAFRADEVDQWLYDRDEEAQRHRQLDALVYQTTMALERFVAAEKPTRLARVCQAASAPELACTLLRYPHAWVRASCARWLAALFSAKALRLDGDGEREVRDTLCGVLEQFGKAPVDEDHLETVLRVVAQSVLYARQLHQSDTAKSPTVKRLRTAAAKRGADGDDADADSDDDDDDDDDDDGDGDDDDDDDRDSSVAGADERRVFSAGASEGDVVRDTLTRLSEISRRVSPLVCGGIFKCMGALVLRLPAAEAQAFLKLVLHPIYLVAPWDQDEAAVHDHGADPALRATCTQVLEALKKHVGVSLFAAACSSVREFRQQEVQQRKEERAASLVAAPVEANKRKLAEMARRKPKSKGRRRQREEM